MCKLEVIAIFKKFILVSKSNARFNIQLVGNMQMYMKINNVFVLIEVCDLFESIRKLKLLKKCYTI